MTEIEKNKIISLSNEGRSYTDIASALCLSESTVKSFFRRTDKQIATCKNCGKMLTILEKRKPKKFCNDNCRITFWRRNRRAKENENTNSNDVPRAV